MELWCRSPKKHSMSSRLNYKICRWEIISSILHSFRVFDINIFSFLYTSTSHRAGEACITRKSFFWPYSSQTWYLLYTSSIHRLYIACTSPIHHLYIACTSPIHHLYITCTSPVHHLYIAYTSPIHHLYAIRIKVIMTSTYISHWSVLLNMPCADMTND